MIWIWSLITLGIIVGATGEVTSPVEETTLDPLTALDKSITADLQNILTKYDRECMDNSEFTENLDLIRKAVKWNKDQLQAKIAAQVNFNNYNERRISLEKQIDQRIEALNNILPTQEPNSRCSKFYLKQRETLKNAKTLSNAGKESAIAASKEICKSNDYNDDYDYY